METMNEEQLQGGAGSQPGRPQFLKILCILTFVGAGLSVLMYALGSLLLSISEARVTEVWDIYFASNPAFAAIDDPSAFMHQAGMVSLYCCLANLFTLLGAIMMWRLEKIGFYVYVVAELITNFISIDMNTGEQSKSYLGMILVILIDLTFIIMYALNLKHMKGKQKTN